MSSSSAKRRSASAPDAPLVTPDGRYLVVRGRLWRRANPTLSEDERQGLVQELMSARRAVAAALKADDAAALRAARARVDRAKHALGERGPVWWTDGAPDENRRLATRSSYAAWFAAEAPGR
ncbi:MAG TPA: hypothetical protein VIL09_01950 [Microvirga sp.]|jgi:hypothetical protein